ncbi:hypothetical protein E2C01_016152 [Portunus trituberculatus]|uniref:Uncharacterized protein n=1 Tax=Portunus trituberculatus TaxID=210409 RepID=A0A5B7DQ74_PORTR|nr:hypothetical protein [Portunus trituberculatus]
MCLRNEARNISDVCLSGLDAPRPSGSRYISLVVGVLVPFVAVPNLLQLRLLEECLSARRTQVCLLHSDTAFTTQHLQLSHRNASYQAHQSQHNTLQLAIITPHIRSAARVGLIS